MGKSKEVQFKEAYEKIFGQVWDMSSPTENGFIVRFEQMFERGYVLYKIKRDEDGSYDYNPVLYTTQFSPKIAASIVWGYIHGYRWI